MPGVNEYISWTDDTAKKKLLHDQHAEAMESNTIHCPCGQIRAMVKAYRCLYCGVYFCAPCAEVHFGQTIQQWREKKQKEAYTTIELAKLL
jgi:ferredoxin-thioredoxin reductase catalytic subunit